MGGKSDITTEGALESAFIHAKEDSFAIYQIRDGIEKARDYRFEGLDYLKERGWEVNRNNYVLVYFDILTQNDTLDSIYQKYNVDCPKNFPGHSLSVSDVIVLQKGGEITSYYVDRIGFAELPAFLGIEKQHETIQNTNTGVEKQDMPQNEQPETPKNEIPVYKFTGEHAAKNGEIDTFRASYKLNVECGEAIDKAITDSNYEQYRYDLKTAVKSVIDEYGADRVAWVLAANVNHHDWDGRLSNDTKAWAKKFETAEPDYHLKTHLAVLDGFASRFREAEKEKPSLLGTLNKTEQKIKQQGKKPETVVDNKNKPKKTNREDM